eukprot:scaffold1102_cov256-Pinguiococcus_pyrenoidosus.AAC.32
MRRAAQVTRRPQRRRRHDGRSRSFVSPLEHDRRRTCVAGILHADAVQVPELHAGNVAREDGRRRGRLLQDQRAVEEELGSSAQLQIQRQIPGYRGLQEAVPRDAEVVARKGRVLGKWRGGRPEKRHFGIQPRARAHGAKDFAVWTPHRLVVRALKMLVVPDHGVGEGLGLVVGGDEAAGASYHHVQNVGPGHLGGILKLVSAVCDHRLRCERYVPRGSEARGVAWMRRRRDGGLHDALGRDRGGIVHRVHCANRSGGHGDAGGEIREDVDPLVHHRHLVVAFPFRGVRNSEEPSALLGDRVDANDNFPSADAGRGTSKQRLNPHGGEHDIHGCASSVTDGGVRVAAQCDIRNQVGLNLGLRGRDRCIGSDGGALGAKAQVKASAREAARDPLALVEPDPIFGGRPAFLQNERYGQCGARRCDVVPGSRFCERVYVERRPRWILDCVPRSREHGRGGECAHLLGIVWAQRGRTARYFHFPHAVYRINDRHDGSRAKGVRFPIPDAGPPHRQVPAVKDRDAGADRALHNCALCVERDGRGRLSLVLDREAAPERMDSVEGPCRIDRQRRHV